jgi:uncharacterized protein
LKHRAIGPSAWILAGAGLLIGGVATWLVSQGNPGNMGLCIACFTRDIAGTFGGSWANMGGVAYLRPEIFGLLLLGATVASFATREFRPRGGSSVILRFVLGFIFMVSSLIFLGCTVRAWLRLGGGDLNALWGVAGIFAGVMVGVVLLKNGFNMGRAKHVSPAVGWVGPLLIVGLLVLAGVTEFGSKPDFLTVTPAGARATAEGAVVQGDNVSCVPKARIWRTGIVLAGDGAIMSPAESVEAAPPMPGGRRAPDFISLLAGLALGVVAQRSRFCSVGGIRDVVLVRRYDLLFGVIGLLVGAVVGNMIFGQFNLGFTGQPIAHTNALGNFASMGVAALAAIMLGGCPFRQVIMSGEGDADATVAVLGMFAGAIVAHRFVIASTGAVCPISPGRLSESWRSFCW